jgi:hypothetical protein
MDKDISVLVSLRKRIKQAECLEEIGSVLIKASHKLSGNDYSYIDKLAEARADEISVDLSEFQ